MQVTYFTNNVRDKKSSTAQFKGTSTIKIQSFCWHCVLQRAECNFNWLTNFFQGILRLWKRKLHTYRILLALPCREAQTILARLRMDCRVRVGLSKMRAFFRKLQANKIGSSHFEKGTSYLKIGHLIVAVGLQIKKIITMIIIRIIMMMMI